MEKKILDVTCGAKTIWFNKNHPAAVYCDKRREYGTKLWESADGKKERFITVDPDLQCDFTNLPFRDNSFSLVIFDPPHLTHGGENSWLVRKYGRLEDNWPEMLRDGFRECMRVLKPDGVLVFKVVGVQPSGGGGLGGHRAKAVIRPPQRETATDILGLLYENRRGGAMRYMKLTENEKARHPSIHYTGSIRGMKKLGFWKKGDRCVRCGQYIYNLSQTIGTYRPVYARGGVLIADDGETGRHLLCRRRNSDRQRAAGEPPGGRCQ